MYNDKHSFSVEMKSGQSVRKMTYLDGEDGQVLFEGWLGEIRSISMVEAVMLEITGQNGTIRLDITKQEIEKSFLSSINGERRQE